MSIQVGDVVLFNGVRTCCVVVRSFDSEGRANVMRYDDHDRRGAYALDKLKPLRHTERWLALIAKRAGVFRVGDRVVVTDIGCFNQLFIKVGDTGVIRSLNDCRRISIRFDDPTKPVQYTDGSNIKKVSSHAS